MINLACAILIGIFSLGINANAAVVNYQGYTYDASNQYVEGGELQWLRWDETNSMSIYSALEAYEDDGWRLATNNEMATLLNGFFGTGFSDSEDEEKKYYYSFTEDDTNDPINYFYSMFGTTYPQTCDFGGSSESCGRTSALYGNDLDIDQFYKLAMIEEDYFGNTPVDGAVSIYTDSYSPNLLSYGNSIGIALVRPSPVPLPSAIWFLLSGLICLCLRSVNSLRNWRLHTLSNLKFL